MRIAMLSTIAWRTPPRHYGPWETIVHLLTEGLIKKGFDVTLYATKDSITSGKLIAVCPNGYEENKKIVPKVWECLHISELFEHGDEYDIIHNHFDFLPLTYIHMTKTPVLTTIHGFSSFDILPVYEKYNKKAYYVAISNADKRPQLDYIATIYHGIDVSQFDFQKKQGDYLVFFGRIHPDKGTKDCIDIALKTGRKLVIAGIIQDYEYYEKQIKPFINNKNIIYLGSVGPEKRNQILGEAYVLLHPIHFDEPFGLSVIESMACGTPVIAYNRGSMPEIIKHGKTGFLVETIDEMIEKLKEVKKIDRFACRKWVEDKFSSERMVDEYISVYKKIISEHIIENRKPWGFYKIIKNNYDLKIKELVIYPGECISYQKHEKRNEHWFVLKGIGRVIINGKEILIKEGESIDIPKEHWHRIINIGENNLIIIELQTGEYLREDDIIRIEDKYGREIAQKKPVNI